MTRRILFDPSEYRDLSDEEQKLLQVAYHKALDALQRNITPFGFTACSLDDNKVYGTDANYRAIWARDGAKTVIWTLDLDNDEIAACRRATLRTIAIRRKVFVVRMALSLVASRCRTAPIDAGEVRADNPAIRKLFAIRGGPGLSVAVRTFL